MKVLLASSSSGSRGGGELYLLYLGEALARRGHEMTLWASDHSRMDELCGSFERFGKVARSKYRNTYDRAGRSLITFFDHASARQVAAEWDSLAPDIIHVNKQNLEDGLDLLRAAELTSRPSVATIHLTQSARYLKAQMALVRDAVSRKALISYQGPLVAVVEQRAEDLRSFLGQTERVTTIPNGVPLADLSDRPRLRSTTRRELKLTDSDLLILAVGRMVPQKSPLKFLELAAQIHRHMPEARFLWVGDGGLAAEWDAWVGKHGMGEIIRRLPWQLDVRPLLFAGDAFLHVAEYEGLPLALLEAMSAELPCAVTASLQEELRFLNEGNSIRVTPDSSWMTVLQDRDALTRTGQEARRLIEAQFSFELMAERYEQAYLELT